MRQPGDGSGDGGDVGGDERLSFLRRPVRPGFEVRVAVLAPGRSRAYHRAHWDDALVVVEHGEIEIECAAGTRLHFGPGAVLWLAGLPLRALHNPGPERAVVSAVARRAVPPPDPDRRQI